MSLSEKVREVEAVFALLDEEISQFRGWSGLSCKTGCGKCCNKADIEATVLEFLPFADALYHLNQSAEWLLRLESKEDSLCVLFQPGRAPAGFCEQYLHRGLICRLFGFSARTNKYGMKEFISCQTIKSEQEPMYGIASDQVRTGAFVPVMNHHYMRLHAIDPELSQKFYPVNEAIRRAIELVLHYYAYRG